MAAAMALVKVYTAGDATEAHFVRTLLERDGIAAVVLGDKLALALGGLPMTQGTLPAVWVPEEVKDAATRLVERYRSGAAARDLDGDEPWTCPGCGEQLEPQFTECWSCGASKPEAEQQDEQPAATRPAVAEEPAPMDYDLSCVRCGYNLRGLFASGRCPECGAPIVTSLLAMLNALPPDLRDEADALVRATIAPAAARAELAPQAVLFALDGWLRAVGELEWPSADDPPPPERTRRWQATRLLRAIARFAVLQFGDAGEAIGQLRNWKLAGCESIARLIFSLIEQGLLEPLPHLGESDFPHGSIELLFAD
jgi:hypothetical protein